MTGVNVPQSAISVGTSGLTVSLGSVSISMNAHWHYREDSFPHISDSGSCDISGSGIGASVTVALGMSAAHEPTVNTAACSAGIGKLDVTFHGGASWLYNLFSGVIADALKKSLSGQMCSIITSEINVEGNKVLSTLPIQEKIDSHALINFELLTPPTEGGDYLATRHKGEFFQIAHPVEAPFTAPPLPVPAAGSLSRMFYVWCSEYLLETAGWVYEQAGVLNYTVQPQQVPASFPLKLNTSSFKLLIPALYQKYPDMLMTMTVAAVGDPLDVQISTAGMLVVGTASLTFNVLQASGQPIPNVFTIDIQVFADGRAWVVGDGTHNSLVANLTLVNVSMTQASSTIGPIKLQGLQFALNIFTSNFLLPAVNKQLNKGFVIPVVDGLTFVNPEVTFGAGFLVIDTDVSYKPTTAAAAAAQPVLQAAAFDGF